MSDPSVQEAAYKVLSDTYVWDCKVSAETGQTEGSAYLQQRNFVAPWYILVPINTHNTPVLLSNDAPVLFCRVLVVLLGVQATVLLDELKGKVHEAAMAAMVLAGVTVH